VRALNLGILAHVDAGKTSLTERLLFAAGVIDAIGRVDDGSTQTDTLALERQRGITIKAAVVSFVVNDVTVNLIDTPGHPDFIAEVERVLSVLDGAVLVVSAVEGVQAQTRALMRTLQRLQIPTLIFVNKVDRAGADPERVLRSIAERLTPAIIPVGEACDPGTRTASFRPYGPADDAFTARLTERLAEHDDALLADYLNGVEPLAYERLGAVLARQSGRALVHPVFVGSAITGAGVPELIAGLTELLPATEADANSRVSGTIFKIERGASGEKVAYARLFSGTIRTRDRLRINQGGSLRQERPSGRELEQKVTAIRVFERGAAVQCAELRAGQIGKLWGLGEVQIGDAVGVPRAVPGENSGRYFAPPTLESVVAPRRASDKGALHAALVQLAEQDPLINLRQSDARQETSVSLYGEVQKEVIQATLATDFSIEVDFRETTTICIERPIGTGAAVDLIGKGGNPFVATVGLRVEPAPIGSGVQLRLDADLTTLPLYVYKSVELFQQAMAETVQETLQQGLYGWQVTDCTVTLTQSGYISPVSTAGDFRKLTPLVLMAALQQAGTVVCEPLHRFQLEVPADTLGAMVSALVRLGAVPLTQELRGTASVLAGEITAARVHELQQRVPGLTRGEGVLECDFDRYRPIAGAFPIRARSDFNPLNRKEYLLHLLRRV
jgi:ribosomal protection tetracycline resistance protein